MQNSQTFLIVAGLALVLIGFVAAKANLAVIRSAIAASKWASVDGTIESTGISQDYDYVGDSGSKRVIFRVVIRYSYRLGNQTYSSNKPLPGGRIFTSFGSAQHTADQYALNKTVKVYVSPEDPTRSTIGVGMRWQWRHWLGLGVSAVLLGLGFIAILARFGVHV